MVTREQSAADRTKNLFHKLRVRTQACGQLVRLRGCVPGPIGDPTSLKVLPEHVDRFQFEKAFSCSADGCGPTIPTQSSYWCACWRLILCQCYDCIFLQGRFLVQDSCPTVSAQYALHTRGQDEDFKRSTSAS